MSMTMGIACETPSNGSVGNQHAAQRFDRQVDAGERRDLRRPRSGGVDDDPSADRAARGLDSGNARAVALNGRDLGRAPDLRAALSCASGEADHHAVGIDEAVGGAEAAAQDVVGTQLRHAGDDVVAGDHAALVQSERILQRLVGPQIVEMRRLGGDEQVSLRTVVRRAGRAARRNSA